MDPLQEWEKKFQGPHYKLHCFPYIFKNKKQFNTFVTFFEDTYEPLKKTYFFSFKNNFQIQIVNFWTWLQFSSIATQDTSSLRT